MPEEVVLPNARIDQLPPNAVVKQGMFLALFNPETGLTERLDAGQLLSSPVTTPNFEWVPNFNSGAGYMTGDARTRAGFWWQSSVDNNLADPTTTGSNWVNLGASNPSGFVPWQAGVYPYDLPFVYKNFGTLDNPIIQMYVLSSPVRPYVSSDLAAEVLAGDWIQWPNPVTPYVDRGPFVYETAGDGTETDFPVLGYDVTRIVTIFLNGVQKVFGVDYTILGVGTVVFPAPLALGVKLGIMFMGVQTLPSGLILMYDDGVTPVKYDDGITPVEYTL